MGNWVNYKRLAEKKAKKHEKAYEIARAVFSKQITVKQAFIESKAPFREHKKTEANALNCYDWFQRIILSCLTRTELLRLHSLTFDRYCKSLDRLLEASTPSCMPDGEIREIPDNKVRLEATKELKKALDMEAEKDIAEREDDGDGGIMTIQITEGTKRTYKDTQEEENVDED